MFRSTWRFSFELKALTTILLIVAFDILLFDDTVAGWTLGGFALAWAAGLAVVRPALVRRTSTRIALGAAMLFAVILLDDPSLLTWTMFWVALSVAALLPRTAGFDDAYRWLARVLLHALSTPAAAMLDARAFFRRRRSNRLDIRSIASLLALPIIGTTVFATLFASANPIIAQVLDAIELPSIWRIMAWIIVAATIWPAFRPRAWVTRTVAKLGDPEIRLPGSSLPSVLLSLAMFNAVFAVQNGLDITFLWSGAALPAGMGMTEYVHRGAYPLIATALLAGFLVLTMLRPGSDTAANPLVRRLVVLWVAQNLVLVASSALRTVDYIAMSMLTAWRIAALIWMLLVALGLMLICWRMLKARTARWLINANTLLATIALSACTVIDIHAVAAAWNVRHAREVGGGTAPLDLCYLSGMSASALVPLAQLERGPLPAEFRDRVRWVRQQALDQTLRAQGDWHSWTWRGARRLAATRALLGPSPPQPRSALAGAYRGCDGSIVRPELPVAETSPPPAPVDPAVPGVATTPLTKAQAR